MDLVTRINWLIERAIEGMERPYSALDAAKYLQVSRSYLYQLVKNKKITCFRPGGKQLYFRKADLDEYVYQNKIEHIRKRIK